jgi:hypothetical protein
MGRARYDSDLVLSREAGWGVPVELEHLGVGTADDRSVGARTRPRASPARRYNRKLRDIAAGIIDSISGS